MRLILASASPRRAELLTAAGYAFDVVPVDVDEAPAQGEAPFDYVGRVARDKALASGSAGIGTVVLTADTTVAVDGQILGKPVDDADATRMLGMLAGREHLVHTGVAVRGGSPRESGAATVEVAVATTRVRFLQMAPREIEWYVASGEPQGKAGAYAIQGRASRFVDWIEGSYSNVVGLPMHVVHRLLTQIGYPR